MGQLLTSIDPVGTLTRNIYDNFGNLISNVADAGPGGLTLTTTATYDARGDPLTVTDARGNVTTSTYDQARRRLSTTTPPTADAPAGLVTRYTYDPAGKVLQTQQSANGSILRTTSATWTRSGKPQTTTDANGSTTVFAYDPLDRLIASTDPMDRKTTYAYDRLGRRISATNPAIQAAPLAQQTFTNNGQRASLIDANGYTDCEASNKPTCFAYDGFDRLAMTTYPDGSTEVLAYDADGNVVSRKTRAGTTVSYAYDTLNRLITKTVPSSPTVTYTYDLAGRQTSVSDNGAAVAPAVPPGGSTVAYTTTYTYDRLNRPTAVSFDPAPTAASPTAGPVVTFGHSYNKANQRTGETTTDSSWIGYPAASASTTAYTANSLNQYTAVGAVTPTYDGNGNLTSDGAYTFGYDAENRLVSASGAGNTSSYAFDGRGRRKTRTVNGTTTVSVTDADNREVLEYDGSTGTLLRWYAYGLGPNTVVSQLNLGASTRNTLIPNLLGSIVGSYDSTGALTKFGYQPYGSGTPATPFGFTGQRIDPETGGLYYYRARHYSTAFGRFLQPDPIGYSGGMHLYAYAQNDPLNAVDPEGLAWEAISGAFQSLTRSDFAATAGNLLQTMADPYVGFVQRSIFGTANSVASFAPALFDPGFYASIQGLGMPGAVIGGVGYATTSTISAIARFGTSVVGGGEMTSLYRAVNPLELADIGSRSGAFRNPTGIEAKYFSTTPQGAASYARQTVGTGLYEGPYTVVETAIPTRLITPIMRVQGGVDRGIPTVVVPTELLQSLRPGNPLSFTPLP